MAINPSKLHICECGLEIIPPESSNKIIVNFNAEMGITHCNECKPEQHKGNILHQRNKIGFPYKSHHTPPFRFFYGKGKTGDKWREYQ
tara:strand:+ start:700 stop:963 length:264 start_codon:yes stop_codon:yes gene_type:complete